MMAVKFPLPCFWIACRTEQRGSHFELAAAAGEACHDKKLRILESHTMEDPAGQRGTEVEIEENPQAKN
jgi:SHS family lactate transporter-like MFS transporter